jgi:hypothetical protein
MKDGSYYPLLPGGVLVGHEPPNYTGNEWDCDPPPNPDGETWQTLDGRRIPYGQLDEKHLLNIVRTCNAGVAKVSAETTAALAREIQRRGLRPLPDYESYEEAMAVSNVTVLYTYWKRLNAIDEPAALTMLALHLEGKDVEQFLVEEDPTYSHEVQRCIAALISFQEWRGKTSPAGQVRCDDVLKRWARAYLVSDVLFGEKP